MERKERVLHDEIPLVSWQQKFKDELDELINNNLSSRSVIWIYLMSKEAMEKVHFQNN